MLFGYSFGANGLIDGAEGCKSWMKKAGLDDGRKDMVRNTS
jgi:hypothetical protein